MERRKLKRYKNPDDRGAYLGGLYFIAAGDGLRVKMGVAEDVKEELKNLQRRNPDIPMELLGYVPGGDEELEREIFVKLIDSHIGDGWFERSLEMEELLDWFDEDSALREIED
jgi:hypothetical protein